MPIRFYCRRCQQLLAIASRKGGTEIDCPKCGQRQAVPAADPGALATPGNALEDVDVAQMLGQPDPGSVRPPPAPPRVDRLAPPPHAGPMPAPPALPPGMVLVRRRMIHLQAAFFFALTAAMFGLGYWLGSQRAPTPTAAPAADAEAPAIEPSLVEGLVVYEDEAGKLLGDVGGVVLALPEGRPPKEPLVLAGMEPNPAPVDPTKPQSPERQKVVDQVGALGGACARVEAKGSFSLVLRPGNYRILFVSAHARRPKGDDINEADLAEMRRYLDAPEKLIGAWKYSWGVHAISSAGQQQRFDEQGRALKGPLPVDFFLEPID